MFKVKRLYMLLGVAILMVACNKTEEKPKTIAQQLADRLQSLQQKGYMMGHQDDSFYGITWEYKPTAVM